MENVLLKENEEILLHGSVCELTPMGFDCDVTLDNMNSLRDESGKFKYLNVEILLRTHAGECSVSGSGWVHSVRRISQQRCVVTVRFKEMEQNGYKLISEHLSPNPVVNLDDVRSKRHSRFA